MNAIDTLTVLIEANYTGLQSQLSQAMNSITNFLSEANGGSINWISILQGNFTPALISTIASTFALSIEQALQMQNAVTTSSQAAGSTFGNNAADMSSAAVNLSQQTGQSAVDIASAMGTVGQTFKDTATAQAVLNTVADESYIKGTSVTEMASLLVPLFKEWNINASDIPQTMADINTAVAAGTIPFEDLITNLTNAGPALSKYTSLASAASQTEVASSLPGMDSQSALDALKTTATALQNPLSQANILLGGMQDIVKNGGMAAAFTDIKTHIDGAGGAAQTLYQGILGDANAVTHFQQTATSDFAKIESSADQLIATSKTLPQQMVDAETATKDLNAAWNNFKDDLLKFVVPGALEQLSDVLNSVGSSFKEIGTEVDNLVQGKSPLSGSGVSFTDFLNEFSKNIGMLLSLGTSGAIQSLGILGASSGGSSVTNNNHYNVNVGANSAAGQSAKKTSGYVQSQISNKSVNS